MPDNQHQPIGIVILAAGASTRLGEPKQQLEYHGETLLQHAVRIALESECNPVIVVLGAAADAILPALKDKPVNIVHNPTWQDGMASSVSCGLKALERIEPKAAGCVFMVCDQPFAEAALLNALVQVKYVSGKGMVACAYQETIGTPALFDKTYFPELLALKGQEGAKVILLRHRQDVATYDFPLGAFDIDTAADYDALLKSEE